MEQIGAFSDAHPSSSFYRLSPRSNIDVAYSGVSLLRGRGYFGRSLSRDKIGKHMGAKQERAIVVQRT